MARRLTEKKLNEIDAVLTAGLTDHKPLLAEIRALWAEREVANKEINELRRSLALALHENDRLAAA